MKTTSGGKITLRRVRADAERVDYAVEAVTPGRAWTFEARISRAGDVAVEGDASVPEWLVDRSRALLRAAWRSAGDLGALPRRISRWRAEPDPLRPMGRAMERT